MMYHLKLLLPYGVKIQDKKSNLTKIRNSERQFEALVRRIFLRITAFTLFVTIRFLLITSQLLMIQIGFFENLKRKREHIVHIILYMINLLVTDQLTELNTCTLWNSF